MVRISSARMPIALPSRQVKSEMRESKSRWRERRCCHCHGVLKRGTIASHTIFAYINFHITILTKNMLPQVYCLLMLKVRYLKGHKCCSLSLPDVAHFN